MIHFVICSITFLQLYLPIVQEANRRGIQSTFHLRPNSKVYANPLGKKNYRLLERWACFYGIRLQQFDPVTFQKIQGLVFLVDGDVYGPRQECVDESVLRYLTDQMCTVSLTESMNYRWSYEKYIADVNHVVFLNKHFATTYNKNSHKNLYLGSPKYDFPRHPSQIYQKYHLEPSNKYLVLFYPKRQFWERDTFTKKDLLAVYEHLRRLGYTILVKTRDKDPVTDPRLQGDRYFSEATMYPSVSLELLTISSLAVLFSSSTVEEAIMCHTPVLDLVVDPDLDRLEFLYTTPLVYKMKFWQDAGYFDYRQAVTSLDGHPESLYNKVCAQYLQSPTEYVSPKILDHFQSQSAQINPLDTTKKLERTGATIWMRPYYGYTDSYLPHWSYALQTLQHYVPALNSPVFYINQTCYYRDSRQDSTSSTKSRPEWISVVHNINSLENMIDDWSRCKGLFFLTTYDRDQMVEKNDYIRNHLYQNGSVEVLSHPFPQVPTRDHPLSQSPHANSLASHLSLSPLSLSHQSLSHPSLHSQLQKANSKFKLVCMGYRNRQFSRIQQYLDTHPANGPSEVIYTPWNRMMKQEWQKQTKTPQPPSYINPRLVDSFDLLVELKSDSQLVLVSDSTTSKINDTMVTAITYQIPIIIPQNPVTTEIFGTDYPLFIERIIGESDLTTRIAASRQKLQELYSQKTLPNHKWMGQILSSRLVQKLLFPTLV